MSVTAGTPGLILAAPASGSGKTTISLALMRAFHRHGLRVAPAKIGPDYIDPGFHSAASGRQSLTLDGWAMRPETRAMLCETLRQDSDLIIAEGVMGLFDGAADGTGTTADIAAETGWPIILIVDVAGRRHLPLRPCAALRPIAMTSTSLAYCSIGSVGIATAIC